MRQQAPSFDDYEGGPDFNRGRTQIATPFQYLDIALDTAVQGQIFNVSGDFLYIDTAFDGVATIELNNQQDAPVAPFRCQSGFALNALFKQLKISWASQPGKKIRLLYSTGERVIPNLAGILTVQGTVSTLESAQAYGVAWKSNAGLTANVPEVVFNPAQNTNGVVLWIASVASGNNGAIPAAGLVAKNAPPASPLDGDMIVGMDNVGSFFSTGVLQKPILIPAGKGLYRITSVTETVSFGKALYTQL